MNDQVKQAKAKKLRAEADLLLRKAAELDGGADASGERWVIERADGKVFFRREHGGQVLEAYAPVCPERAAVYAAAISQGMEPPRALRGLEVAG